MVDAQRSLHRQLFETINKEMDDDDFRSFRSIAQGKGLRPGEASKCNTPSDVLDKLQRKGKIKLGCYQALKDIFAEMEQEGLIEEVTKTERKLEEMGCEISDEIPQPYDNLKRQASYPGESAEEKRRRFRAQSSSSSLDSNPSFERQISPTAEQRRGSMTSHWQFDSSASARHPLRRQSSSRSLPRSPQSSFDDNDVTREPLEEREDCYKQGRGYVLIINNFSEEREASKNDVEGLSDFFEKIGYKVEKDFKLNDLKKDEMMDALDRAKLEIQKTAKGKNKYSCFICIVSSHGDKEGVKSYDNQTVSIAELQAPFLGDKLQCMAGSPKMFIIQSCRGKEKQPGVDRADEEPGDERQLDVSDVMSSVTTPRDADVLVAYATTEGFQAFRRVGEGSWFLSKMLAVFNHKHQSEHLLDMLTEVNDRVSHRTAIGSKPAKQMPCQVSTFTKKFYF